MALITKAIKGTKDVLPKDVHKNQYIEATALDIASKFGYKEIRTPVFEHTELFQRGVGDTTDVVQKEMYTFDDKGGRSITLRPEGTAGAVTLKTDFATRRFRKRFAISPLATDTKSRRQAGLENSISSVLNVSAQPPLLQTLKLLCLQNRFLIHSALKI